MTRLLYILQGLKKKNGRWEDSPTSYIGYQCRLFYVQSFGNHYVKIKYEQLDSKLEDIRKQHVYFFEYYMYYLCVKCFHWFSNTKMANQKNSSFDFFPNLVYFCSYYVFVCVECMLVPVVTCVKIIKTTPLNEAKTVSIAALHLQRKKRATVIQLYVCCHHTLYTKFYRTELQIK